MEEENREITVGEFVEMLWGESECRGAMGSECGSAMDSECEGAALSEEAALNEGASAQSGASLTLSELLRYGHFRGWLEDRDERHPETSLNRQTAARIIHQFMVVELHIKDIADIKGAEILRDLYICRVCANHIAQVYLRGIMGVQEIEVGECGGSEGAAQPVLIFNHLGRLTFTEAREAMAHLRSSRPERTNVS